MPISAELPTGPLTTSEIEGLWRATCAAVVFTDEVVNVKEVSSQDMRTLNHTYRAKDRPTNVLTFSYPAPGGVSGYPHEHDVALCMEVARAEAETKRVALKDYVALLLVHAFLHVAGLDHEKSAQEAKRTSQLEQAILYRQGFVASTLT